MQTTRAFVARSFSEKDDPKVSPIVKFLENFSALGFVAASAERAEPELVSRKVRDKIDAADVFVCILTRRHPIVSLEQRVKTAWQIIVGRPAVRGFTAPPWLLQELGYALRGGKRLLIFRESDVEVPMLPGDYEYIDFDNGQYDAAFGKATSMINAILAERAGITLEVTATLAAERPPTETSITSNAQAAVESKPTFGSRYLAVREAITQGNLSEAEAAFDVGLRYMEEHEADAVLFWKCLYQETLANAGQAEAIEALQRLHNANPRSPEPLAAMARTRSSFGDHIKARDYYLAAAELDTGDSSKQFKIAAAREMKQAGQLQEAKATLVALLTGAGELEQGTKLDALQELHRLLKEIGDTFSSYAIGELCLDVNPAQSDFRFALGLAYHDSDYPELFLHHFTQVHAHNAADAAAVHNLALACSENKLAIASVEHYQRAIDLGETLSASNLAHKFLNEGFATEAKLVLSKFDVNAASELISTSASINEKTEEEKKQLAAYLEKADEYRRFLLKFGEAFLAEKDPDINGNWRFPFGNMALSRHGKKVSGKFVEKSMVLDAAFGLLGNSPKPAEKLTQYTFDGILVGRTCSFEITIEVSGAKQFSDYLLGGSHSKKGYVIFSSDGKSATALETDNGKPKESYQIARTSVAAT